jgi:hypothetical protein
MIVEKRKYKFKKKRGWRKKLPVIMGGKDGPCSVCRNRRGDDCLAKEPHRGTHPLNMMGEIQGLDNARNRCPHFNQRFHTICKGRNAYGCVRIRRYKKINKKMQPWTRTIE